MLKSKKKFNNWAVKIFKEVFPLFITCESVIAESSFLLRKVNNGVAFLFELLKEDVIQINFNLQTEHESISALLNHYSDIPISLADACLIRMSELLPNLKNHNSRF